MLFDKRNSLNHLLWHVAHSKNYLLHSNLRKCTKLVEYNGAAYNIIHDQLQIAKLHKRLWFGKRKGSKSSPKSAN